MSLDVAAKRPNWFARLANPGQFLAWSRPLLWPLAGVTALLFLAGLYFALFDSPPDYQMGETVRIMYIHVPTAILAEGVYVLMALAALGTLVWRHPLADVANQAAAPLGALFTGLALISGSLWGRPTWGTFWEWDGRMTSFLILFLIYLGIVALWRAFDDPSRAGRIVAVFTLVGALDIPVVKYSVDWWNTLHQGASIDLMGDRHMANSMLLPLGLMTLAFGFLFLTLYLVRIRTEIFRRRLATLARQAAGATP